MEFGLHECIPIYGGGLGILAGDFLKAASDLGMPMVGIGLVYKYGYFTQRINLKGVQEELFLEFDNHLVPMHEMRGPEGERVYIEMQIVGDTVRIKLWQIDVGKTELILLDTDIEENPPALRHITNELYVADRDKRLQQELVLGIGGVRALKALGITPKVYHINEGHSAFLVIARLQELMREKGLGFTEAKAMIRASTVFTTHTPVIAGNENFDTAMVRSTSSRSWRSLGLSFEDLAGHGFVEPDRTCSGCRPWRSDSPDTSTPCPSSTGTCPARCGRACSRTGPTPRCPSTTSPTACTIRGSAPTSRSCSTGTSDPATSTAPASKDLWDKIFDIPDEQIWQAHRKNKQSLITFIREKLADDLAERGYIQSKILKLGRDVQPGVPDGRLRPAVCPLQAADPHPEGQGAAQADPDRPRGPCSSSSRARPTRPTPTART